MESGFTNPGKLSSFTILSILNGKCAPKKGPDLKKKKGSHMFICLFHYNMNLTSCDTEMYFFFSCLYS